MNPITTADIDRLRRRIERIEGGRMAPSEPAPAAADELDDKPQRYQPEGMLDGEVLENPHGKYFLQQRLYPNHKLHGSFDIGRLADMPGKWLEGVSKGDIPAHDPHRWVFLDTETTGLAGGTGTCAFLIGVGTIEPDGFRVRLFFMRDYNEEAAMLYALAEFLQFYDVLVTYNGKSYDAPLIETRYRLQRRHTPLDRMHHLDLLHGARSLFKLRMENCRLMNLEYELLGLEREGDLPGELIPYYYFEYLRTKQAFKLVPLFHHNVMDIVSLACLTATVLPAFAAPEQTPFQHGEDLLGLARWLRRAGAQDSAVTLYRRAVQAGMMDNELFAALWETALLEKKRGRHAEKAQILRDLTQVHNPYRAQAFDELAKHFERHEKDLEQAHSIASLGMKDDPSEDLARRHERLTRRLERAREDCRGEACLARGSAYSTSVNL